MVSSAGLAPTPPVDATRPVGDVGDSSCPQEGAGGGRVGATAAAAAGAGAAEAVAAGGTSGAGASLGRAAAEGCEPDGGSLSPKEVGGGNASTGGRFPSTSEVEQHAGKRGPGERLISWFLQ